MLEAKETRPATLSIRGKAQKKICVEARGLAAPTLDRRVKLGGMNDFHAAAKEPDAKVASF